MRLPKLFILMTVAMVVVGSESALAQQNALVIPQTPMAGDQAMWASQATTRTAKRVRLARQAAALVNAGQCPDALKLARAAGDQAMAAKITEVCAAPPQRSASL